MLFPVHDWPRNKRRARAGIHNPICRRANFARCHASALCRMQRRRLLPVSCPPRLTELKLEHASFPFPSCITFGIACLVVCNTIYFCTVLRHFQVRILNCTSILIIALLSSSYLSICAAFRFRRRQRAAVCSCVCLAASALTSIITTAIPSAIRALESGSLLLTRSSIWMYR